MKKNVLIVAAHPDDEILGCGGTIAKYKNKYNFYCLFLTDGVSSRSNGSTQLNKEIKERIFSAKKAAKIIGIKKIFFGNFPDNSLDSIPRLNVIKYIEKYIKIVKPYKIYTHNPFDLNIDHSIVSKAVVTATRPFKSNLQIVNELLFFEIPSSTEWNFGSKNFFRPNVFEDIKKNIRIKLKALKCYKSELKKYPHPRSLKGVKVYSEFRGITSGLENAEAFILSRKIK
tara:strand:+ start:1098 stop:1781 length:684 start_codon:yes stop_codon:yes gene_type:complete